MDHANQEMNNIYNRDLKLKFVKWPNSKEKLLRGLQFTGKKLSRAAIYKKSSQNKLNLTKLYTLVIFEMFEGRTNASGGPHAARDPCV